MASDLDIARAATLRPIGDVAADMGIPQEYLEPYGKNVMKVGLEAIDSMADRPKAKYVVVSAITPTPLGEGKTTTSVGLAQGLGKLGKQAVLTLRQPSMGPTFGIKGGAAGGGMSQVVPMETLNLHLTGDFHAVTAAHNLLAALLDNHLHHGNELDIDPRSITWPRVLDVNDRALRQVVIGLGGRADGVTRQSSFDITAASEVMALLSLASDLDDLRSRLGRIVVGFTRSGAPVTAEQLQGAGSMAVILREALKPNLLQTLEGTPALIHCGPFGNIATGNSSVVADLVGLRGGDYVVTEAGFGADMGAERFFNIKCRASGQSPDAAVVVVTTRALKAHSGKFRIVPGKPLPDELLAENTDDVEAGAPNLVKQIENIRLHGVSPVVAINSFPTDHASEHETIRRIAEEAGARVAVATHFSDGGAGAVELAEAVRDAAEEPSDFRPLYDLDASLHEKIETVARRVYGADGIDPSAEAAKQLAAYEAAGFGTLPVCIAKTHLSLSSDASLTGAPTGWRMPVREVRVSAGAGFVYPIAGTMRTMPGLSRHPAAHAIDLDDDGEIVNLS
ncbi:MAG TPA: formate--tetrahydrofolate ligase [Ornithinimicrobium sp.]|uniref:formate--tetrahydrofolate ligase n=1 Tax=Ornithinimicrobium sp. TaxID=1977084 RepID=UPI002B4862F8|nr:formate--tetrahydrofolate ligase [Ornithinimicrobium sp.]HKJ12176.1 formate--tetrahydrofolate ligase [Ornithinimicrobium sp.]